MASYRAILFDLGNTLLEFENAPWPVMLDEAFAEAWQELRPRVPDLPEAPFLRAAFDRVMASSLGRAEHESVDLRIERVLCEALASLGVRAEEEELRPAAFAHYRPIGARVTAYEDARSTLAELRGRGFRIGLVSNTLWPSSVHGEELVRFGLDEFFDATIFSSDVGATKPRPEIFAVMLRRLSVSPSSAMMIGDRRRTDVEGAKRLGITGVLKEHAGSREKSDVAPDHTIRSLSELLGLPELRRTAGEG